MRAGYHLEASGHVRELSDALFDSRKRHVEGHCSHRRKNKRGALGRVDERRTNLQGPAWRANFEGQTFPSENDSGPGRMSAGARSRRSRSPAPRPQLGPAAIVDVGNAGALGGNNSKRRRFARK